MKWNCETKEIEEDIILIQQNTSFIEEEKAIAATICFNKCFIVTNAGLFRGFYLKTRQELFKLPLFNCNFISKP